MAFDQEQYMLQLKEKVQEGATALTVVGSERLDPTAPDHTTIRLTFEGTGSQAPHPNDFITVRWRNIPDAVDRFLEDIDEDPERIISIDTFSSPLYPGGRETLPLRAALMEHLEIQTTGPELLKKYGLNSIVDHNIEQRQQLLAYHAMAEAREPADYSQYVDTTQEVFLPSLLPHMTGDDRSIERLLEYQPRIAYRPYTMSDFRRIDSTRFQAEITVSVVQKELAAADGSSVDAFGRATSYLASLQAGDTTHGFILPDRHRFPQSSGHHVPLIIFATGAGIAGPMSMLRAGYQGGPLWIIYGVRTWEHNHLYGPELQSYLHDGTVTRLDIAESRPSSQSKPREYVTDIIKQNTVELMDWLNRGAHVFLCGRLSMGVSVNRAIMDLLIQSRQCPDNNAAHLQLQSWYDEQRFQASVSRI
ncbi:MAG: hypothetical protein ACOCVC_07700 [Spirochaeta sp.]